MNGNGENNWLARVTELHREIATSQEQLAQLINKIATKCGGNRFRLGMFGSALLRGDHQAVSYATELGNWATSIGLDRTDGGGGSTMNAFVRAKHPPHGENVGQETFTLRFPMNLPDIEATPVATSTELWAANFGLRLIYFGIFSTSFVAFPGGIGTLLEIVWFLQMIQKMRLAGNDPEKLQAFRFIENPASIRGLIPLLVVFNQKREDGSDERYYDYLQRLLEVMDEEGALNKGDKDIIKFSTELDDVKSLVVSQAKRWLRFCDKHGLEVKHDAVRKLKAT